MTIASAALLLFLILDPLGNVPVFLSLLRNLPPKRQRIVLARELLIALVVLMLFLWAGKYALDLMHLREESVSIAGGIVLFPGPSGMAAVILMGSNDPTRLGDWSLALMIAWAATAAILFSAIHLYKWLGQRVLTAIERLMGMLLVAISVQMLMDGITAYLRIQAA